jgi:hypothetical protein
LLKDTITFLYATEIRSHKFTHIVGELQGAHSVPQNLESVTSGLCVRPKVTSQARVPARQQMVKSSKGEGSSRGFKFKEVGKYTRRMASNYLSVCQTVQHNTRKCVHRPLQTITRRGQHHIAFDFLPGDCQRERFYEASLSNPR